LWKRSADIKISANTIFWEDRHWYRRIRQSELCPPLITSKSQKIYVCCAIFKYFLKVANFPPWGLIFWKASQLFKHRFFAINHFTAFLPIEWSNVCISVLTNWIIKCMRKCIAMWQLHGNIYHCICLHRYVLCMLHTHVFCGTQGLKLFYLCFMTKSSLV
jgi:hypothetical protein